MKRNSIQKLVISALLAAMTCVATMIIKIPIQATGGYINLGDGVAIISGIIMGPVYGAAAAGIGSALADIFSGYAVYAAATFVIKAAMAALAGIIVKNVCKARFPKVLLAGALSELVMVGGYLVFEALILGMGIAAVQGVLGNAIQAAGGLVTAAVLFPVVKRLNVQSLREKEKTENS